MMDKGKSFFSGILFPLQSIIVVLLMLPIVVCQTGTSLSRKDTPATQEVKQKENPYANAEIATRIIPSVNNTFGYDILLYGRPLVHQPTIPGLTGNESFATQERAQTVADFMVKKIRENKMPSTVTMEDLNTVGVLI
jgi:hypothetical protein